MVIVPSWGDGVIAVILDTVHQALALVTPPGIGYRRAHVDARRGFWGSPDADRGGGRGLVAPHGGAGVRAARLACVYEQAHVRAENERARTDAAEARAVELRRAEVDSRSRAGSLKWQLDTCRNKLKAAAEETKEVRRAAKDALSFQAEVARLEKLLSEAGVESSKRSTIMLLRKAVKASQARAERLEGQLAKLRATRAVLSKALFGSKSERQ